MVKKHFRLLLLLIIMFTVIGCQQEDNQEGHQELDNEAVEVSAMPEAVVVGLINSHGMEIATATLTEQSEGGVKIILEGDNLPPGEHGFHIHDRGACVPPDFESAGGHYNPTNSKHGFKHPNGPHAGDLENILVKEDGSVYVELEAKLVSLDPDHENTLFTKEGTSLVIHENPDDYISQPAGNAGARIACGVIGE